MNKKQTIRLNENYIRKIVENVIKEAFSDREYEEFTYGDSTDLGRGRYRQDIIYRDKTIGYLLSFDNGLLAPIEERYVLPDVERGMLPGGEGLLDGKKGWIEFKVFDNYEEAFKYASDNFEEIVYLFENGDYD